MRAAFAAKPLHPSFPCKALYAIALTNMPQKRCTGGKKPTVRTVESSMIINITENKIF
jgi:hypothetical protein